jgi:AraC-like DNA-binding protein
VIVAVLLDTKLVDPEDREAAFRHVLTSATAPHDLSLLGPADQVHARLDFWQFGPSLAVLKQTSSGIRHRRDQRHDHTEGPERVVFVLHDGPTGTYLNGDETHALRSGALYATDLNSHYGYSRPGDGTARILQVERSSLGMTAEQVRVASTLVTFSPLYGLFRSHVAQLATDAAAIAESSESEAIADQTMQLAASLLRTSVLTDRVPTEFLLERIRLYLRLNFARRDMTPELVARAHNISLRYLFKVWASEPSSLMDTVYSLRLEYACRLLETESESSISEVAMRCGFENFSHFSHRYRREFGLTPSEFRHIARQHG